MKIAVIAADYPDDNKPERYAFIHSRVRAYINENMECKVFKFVRSSNEKPYSYIFENVNVFVGNEKYLLNKIQSFSPDILCMHAIGPRHASFISRYFSDIPKIMWVHGADLMSTTFYYPYDGNIFLHPARFILRLTRDFKKKYRMREFILREKPIVVFVSNYMKKMSERFLGLCLDNLSFIIPNPIDEDIFEFQIKSGKIKELICVRSHNSSKYALDLVIKAFSNSKYKVVIYGKGKYIKQHKRLADKYHSNVEFIEKFFSQKELSTIYKKYKMGIMLSRLDAQGVSACEMNMAGLPVITSDIEGNAEFSTRGTIRIKNKEYWKVEQIIDEINNNEGVIEKMSKYAHEDMVKIAGKKKVIAKEISLIKSAITIK